MIKILKVSNSSRGMSIEMPTLESLINNAIEDNNIDENKIINIELTKSTEANIVYKV